MKHKAAELEVKLASLTIGDAALVSLGKCEKCDSFINALMWVVWFFLCLYALELNFNELSKRSVFISFSHFCSEFVRLNIVQLKWIRSENSVEVFVAIGLNNAYQTYEYIIVFI